MSHSESSGPRAPLSRVITRPVLGLGRRISGSRAVVDKQEQTGEPALVDCALYENGKRVGGSLPLQGAYEAAKKSKNGFVWVGLRHPTAELFEQVAAEFPLHPLAVEDAVNAHQRPKIDNYKTSLFVVLKPVRYIDPHEIIEVGEIMLFVGSNFVVTVRHGEATKLTEVREELAERPDLVAVGPSAILYAVADRVVDHYETALASMSEDIEEVEAFVFDARSPAQTERIYKLKRELIEFRRAIEPLNSVIDHLASGEYELVDQRVLAYLRDVHDHLLRSVERITAFDELLRDGLQATLAQVTLQQNEDVRKISAWAAILAAITLISGIYGMNFHNIPELTWHYGYFICLGLMAGISVALYGLFRRRDWL